MNGKQGLVALLGLGLVAANLWTGPQKQALQGLAGGKLSDLSELKVVGAETLGVFVMAFVAGLSDQVANVILVFTIGLWILFAIRATAAGKTIPLSFAKTSSSTNTTGGVIA